MTTKLAGVYLFLLYCTKRT